MKFTDGYWQLRKGVKAHYPAQAHDIELSDHVLTVYAPTKRIAHRGDTLNGALLTIEFTAPLPDVIGVTVTHFAGARPPHPRFELFAQPDHRPVIEQSPTDATLASGRLKVRVPRAEPWRVDFIGDGRPLTHSGRRGLGCIELDSGERYLHEQLGLAVGELVYGLGERFTAFVKNGQAVEMWNQDGGTASEQAYKNVPFYLTNRGYGVFVNHPGRVSFEVASEKVSRAQFSAPGETLQYFVIYGPTPKAVLEKYTALTGRPARPPAWSFGLWLTTSFTTSYDEATVTQFIEGMAERDLPLHVFHFDCFWMREFNWCDFQWDKRTFPDPPAMLARLKARGLRLCVWINPYIAQRSPLFAEGMRAGYLLKKPNGEVWQIDQWQPGMGMVDFTHPDARRWFGDKLRALLDMGVDCFKTDFGERIPTEVVWHDGGDPERMHNYYTLLYNQTVFDLLRERRGEGEAVVFARSATAGGQRCPVHWGGDSESTFESMAESLRGGLSLGLSGFGFWSHDIGGFDGTPPADVYKRWIAFGLLSSHSRLHGNHSYRVPWLFDDEAVEVLRRFTKLKCRLMPYLYAQALQAVQRGWPVMRAMLLEFPDDPACEYLDRQYLLGDSLLVAPVFSRGGDVTYYVPPGRWTHFLSGRTVDGPGWVREQHDMLSLPLLARPNSIIAVGGRDDRPDYDYALGPTLHVFALDDNHEAAAVIPTLAGEAQAAFTAKREGRTLTIEVTGSASDWKVLLVGLEAVAEVQNAAAEKTAQGTLLRPASDSARITLSLA